MRIISRGGPHDGRRWTYQQPLPDSIMLLDAATLGYHEYRRNKRMQNVYEHVGCVGVLPVPKLD